MAVILKEQQLVSWILVNVHANPDTLEKIVINVLLDTRKMRMMIQMIPVVSILVI